MVDKSRSLGIIVEEFNNGSVMATVNFSVPDAVKADFDRVFSGQNKSAIVAELLRKAVAEAAQRTRRQRIFQVLTQRRSKRPRLSDDGIRAARVTGRP